MCPYHSCPLIATSVRHYRWNLGGLELKNQICYLRNKIICINNIFIRRNDRIEGLISYFKPYVMMSYYVIGYVCAFIGLIGRYILNPSAAYDLKRAGEVTVGIRPSLYWESLLIKLITDLLLVMKGYVANGQVTLGLCSSSNRVWTVLDFMGFYGILFVDSLVFLIKNLQCYFTSPLFSIVRNAWIISSILHPPISPPKHGLGAYHVSVSSCNSSRQRCRKSHQLPSQSNHWMICFSAAFMTGYDHDCITLSTQGWNMMNTTLQISTWTFWSCRSRSWNQPHDVIRSRSHLFSVSLRQPGVKVGEERNRWGSIESVPFYQCPAIELQLGILFSRWADLKNQAIGRQQARESRGRIGPQNMPGDSDHGWCDDDIDISVDISINISIDINCLHEQNVITNG